MLLEGATDAARAPVPAGPRREPRFEELVALGEAPSESSVAGRPADAQALPVGERPSDVPAVPEHAAWTVVCGTVLNLSEAVTRG